MRESCCRKFNLYRFGANKGALMLVKTIVCVESCKKSNNSSSSMSCVYHAYSMAFYGCEKCARLCTNQSPRLNLIVFVVGFKIQCTVCGAYVSVCYSLHSASLQTEYISYIMFHAGGYCLRNYVCFNLCIFFSRHPERFRILYAIQISLHIHAYLATALRLHPSPF